MTRRAPSGWWIIPGAVIGLAIWLMILRVAFLLLATPAHAEQWRAEPGGSTVTLRLTKEPGAVAEVLFRNSVGDAGGRVEHTFRLGDLEATAVLGTGLPDTLTIDPPEGFWADPRTLELPDGASGVIYIRPLSDTDVM
jgi:hypothetical protein